jgi:1-acyl-sn-glycerol-3-phosphate acyltransferase
MVTFNAGFIRAAFTAQKKPAAPPPITTKCLLTPQRTMKNHYVRYDKTEDTLKYKSRETKPTCLLYSFLKIWVRLAALIFCRKIIINNRALLKEKGPLLLASNHPNSFLDSVILDILFEQPIWSLARGDTFLNKTVSRIFHSLKMMPIYRTSEGVGNLNENYKTFDACIEVFKKDGVVQIFSEGKCINEWHLRPLKKGTARLALSTWEKNIPLRVLPVAINYSSFHLFGKNIFFHFGKIITKTDIDTNVADGLRNQQFNNLLREELEKGVFEIESHDVNKRKELLAIKIPGWKKLLLFIPAIAGFLLNAPLYLPLKYFVSKKYKNSDHFDSVILGILIFAYPLYLLLLTICGWLLLESYWVITLLLIIPFTAWSYVQLKKQIN